MECDLFAYINMGCLCSLKSTAVELIVQIEQNNLKIQEIHAESNELDGKINLDENFPDTQALILEKNKGIQNLMKLFKLFPDTINEKEPLTDEDTISAKDFISNRLKISDRMQRICQDFPDMMATLKKIDTKKIHTLGCTIESLEYISTVKNFLDLKPSLNEVRERQIILCSYRGGEIVSLLKRIQESCIAAKKLEIIQAKIEREDNSAYLNNVPEDNLQLGKDIMDLIDKKQNHEKIFKSLEDQHKEKIDKLLGPLNQDKLLIEQEINAIKASIKDLKALKKSQEDKELEIVSIYSNIDQIDTQINSLKLKIPELSKEKEAYLDLNKLSNKLITKISSKNQRIKDLNHELNYLQSNFDVEDQIEDVKDEKIKELEEDIMRFSRVSLSLSQNIDESLRKHEEKLKTQIGLRLYHSLKENLMKWFWKWKGLLLVKTVDASIFQSSYCLDAIDTQDFNDADIFINHEREEMLAAPNILSKYIQESRVMDQIKLYKFLEDLMDKKYELDTKEIKDRVTPSKFPEFLNGYILKLFGMPKAAEKQIISILYTLKSLSDSDDKYSKFYCSLFNIHTLDPVPYELGLYLTSARYNFQSLIYKHEKRMLSIGRKPPSPADGAKFKEYISKGGYASLSDIIDLVVSILYKDKNTAIQALQMLRPDTITHQEFIIFQICQKVVRLGRSVEAIFTAVDKNSNGAIDRRELNLFTRTSMDLWVDEKDLDNCFSNLELDENGEIPKETFINTFNLITFQEAVMSDKYLVSKVKFLTVLVLLYKEYYRRQCAGIFAVLNLYSDPLSRPEFIEIILFLDQNMREKSDSLFNEVCCNAKVSYFDMAKLVLKYRIGDISKGPFTIDELYNETDNRNSIRQSNLSARSFKSRNSSPNYAKIMN
jgi:hypothetical protein